MCVCVCVCVCVRRREEQTKTCTCIDLLFFQSDIIVGFPGDNLLSAILEALSSPSYSYIGLNYDNSYSFETGK